MLNVVSFVLKRPYSMTKLDLSHLSFEVKDTNTTHYINLNFPMSYSTSIDIP